MCVMMTGWDTWKKYEYEYEYNMSGFAVVIILNLKSYSEVKRHSYFTFSYDD